MLICLVLASLEYDQRLALPQVAKPYPKSSGNKKKDGDDTGLKEADDIKKLVEQMEDALVKDRKSNEIKKPAFLRLLMLTTIENSLRKTLAWKEEFLHQDGCQIMSDWLKQMPDATFPNPKIVMCIMGCIDRLPIDESYLKESDLEEMLKVYRDGEAGSGYVQCQMQAKQILNKWYRAKYKIQTNYDAEGRFDEGWRSLQRDLEKERKKADSDDEGEPGYKRQKLDDEPKKISQFLDRDHRQDQHKFTRRPQHQALE